MKLKLKVALAAGLICISGLADAATYVKYTFNFTGTGTRQSQSRSGTTVTTEALKGATLIMAFNIQDSNSTGVFGADGTSFFSLALNSIGLGFGFSPAPNQSNFYAAGSGTACLPMPLPSALPQVSQTIRPTCGGISYEATAPRAIYEERFSGSLDSVIIEASEGGGFGQMFSIVGFVPEPSIWAMMLTGFGMMAYALRRRTLTVANA